jgi:hypothetical protein
MNARYSYSPTHVRSQHQAKLEAAGAAAGQEEEEEEEEEYGGGGSSGNFDDEYVLSKAVAVRTRKVSKLVRPR